MVIKSHIRSMTKSIIWRLLGIAILAVITYIFTCSWIQTGLITFLHHFAFVFIYYLHERLWLKINWSERKKRWVRPITYEVILGHLVLGFISFIVTGVWPKATLITITYIENKLWIYVVYDWLWDKNSWGKNKGEVA